MLPVHGCISGVKINLTILIDKNTRIKLAKIICPPAEHRLIRMADKAEKFIFSGRCITYCHANLRQEIQAVIQIKSSVTSLYDVRCPQCMNARCVQSARKTAFCIVDKRDLVWISAFLIAWVLLLSEDNTLVPPVIQMIQRCRIANVIIQAEHLPVKAVMTSIYIQPVAEYVRLSVRHVFIQRKIWIVYLFFLILFHRRSLLFHILLESTLYAGKGHTVHDLLLSQNVDDQYRDQ